METQLPSTPQPQVPQPGTAPHPSARETILVVDDGSADQAAALGLLQSLGYRLLRAADPQAALGILRGGTQVDLVLADAAPAAAPGGDELARHARAADPGIAVLLTSAPGAASGTLSGAGVEYLPRPYRPDELARSLRHLLANQQQVNALASALRDLRHDKAARRARGPGPGAR